MLAVIDSLLNVYKFIVLIRCVVSWFQPNPYNQFYQLLIQLTEPILGPIRRVIPTFGMLDLSPIVVIILIEIVRGTLLYVSK